MSVYNGCNNNSNSNSHSNNTNRMTLCRFPQAFVNRSYKLSSKNTIKLKSANWISYAHFSARSALFRPFRYNLSRFHSVSHWQPTNSHWNIVGFLYIFLNYLACDEDEKQMIKLQQSQATAQSAPKSPCDFQPTKYEYYERLPFIFEWLQPFYSQIVVKIYMLKVMNHFH